MPVSERISKRERADKPKKRKKKAKATEALPPTDAVSVPEPKNAENSGDGAKNFPLAAACMNLPTRAEVLALDGAGQRACFKRLGDTTNRIIRLLGDVQAACSTGDSGGFEHDEDAMVADMAKLRTVPMARHFVEHALWKRVKRLTDGVVSHVDDKMNGGGGQKKEDSEFRNSFTQKHGEELDSIREREQLDECGVNKLLVCVDEAAQLYTAALSKSNKASSSSL